MPKYRLPKVTISEILIAQIQIAQIQFPASEAESDYFVDVCHAVTTLHREPDSILAPMIQAAKANIDYQMIIQALHKTKNPKSLPLNHPGRQLNSVWS